MMRSSASSSIDIYAAMSPSVLQLIVLPLEYLELMAPQQKKQITMMMAIRWFLENDDDPPVDASSLHHVWI